MSTRIPRIFGALLAPACLALTAATARADVASWLFVGSGGSVVDGGGVSRDLAPALAISTGLGLPASYAVSVGGLVKWQTHFGEGTDLAAFLRTSSRGYNLGDFGIAVDLGAYKRFFFDDKPGFEGTVSLGAPWGITLNLDGADDTDKARTFAVLIGIDFARFTAYRRTGTNWWPNPYPVVRSEHVGLN